MSSLYPLKFKTIFKEKIWGGQKIRSVLGKDFSPLNNCGETWEISGVRGNVSEVANGYLSGKTLKELLSEFKSAILGKKVYDRFGDEFPLLIKFIDANDDLSIQVHPDDKLASERHGGFGKTEMWYVLHAEPDAWLFNGFSKKIDGAEYINRIKDDSITEVLHKEYVNAGDIYFIPAGRVHSIGKGIMIAEIQQTSDITYRIYDFDRRDADGNTRELHTLESEKAINFELVDEYKSPISLKVNASANAVHCPYFSTNVIDLESEMTLELRERDSFTILMAVEGSAQLKYNDQVFSLDMGEVVLLPAELNSCKLFTLEHCRVIETFVP